MIDNELPVEQTETPVADVPTGEAPAPQEEQSFDIEKSDNVSQIRAYANGLKKDLDTYKGTHSAVTEKFGDVRNLDIAHSIFTGFAGQEFDPDAFSKVLEQLSPARTQQLFEKVASAKAPELVTKEIEKMFGGKVSPDDIALFKQAKENNFGLGKGDDIPEELKINKDGTPKSDEEIAWLRQIHKQVKETNEAIAARDAEAQSKSEMEKQEKIADAVRTFSNERVKILDAEFKTLGLEVLPTDTAEQRADKETLRQFFINGVSSLFLENPSMAEDYHSAVAHISKGENLLARAYEARIEKNLVEIMRSKPLGRLLSALVSNESQEPEVRPDISKTRTSEGGDAPQGSISADDIFAGLVKAGKIKP